MYSGVYTEVQLSGIGCLTQKLLQCTLNRRLLQVAGAFHKRSQTTSEMVFIQKNQQNFYLSLYLKILVTLVISIL